MKDDNGEGNFLIWDGESHRIVPMALLTVYFSLLAEFLDRLSNVMYASSKTNRTLNGHVISSEKSVESSLQCMKHCANIANGQCKSFNHNEVAGECQLNNETGRDGVDDLKITEGYNHYYITKTDPIMLP